jgi:hypothetical protein
MTRLDTPSGSLLLVSGLCGAGSPARRRGNFLLAPQKKTEGFGEAKVTALPGAHPGTALASHQK